MFGKKKKENIEQSEVFDARVFSFKKSDKELEDYILDLEGINNKHMKLFVNNSNKCDLQDTLPSFIKRDGNNFVLILSEFLNYSYIMSATSCETESEKYVEYRICTRNSYIECVLEFRESDVYPSVSKYITDKALDAIYKNTCKGE